MTSAGFRKLLVVPEGNRFHPPIISRSALRMSKRYVDNASNRQLGRVGKPVGTHVVSRSGTAASSYGSRSSASSTRSSGCYVDNQANRQIGRVGKPYGTHVVHSSGTGASGTGSSTRPGCYVDNDQNRQLGRVGKPYGTHVVHNSGEVTVSGIGASGTGSSTRPGRYVDNDQNRRLGRVGKPYGTHVVSNSGDAAPKGGQRCYIDNAFNRRLGRVGKPLGAHVVRSTKSTRHRELVDEYTLQDLIEILQGLGLSDARRPNYVYAVEVLERETIEERWREDGASPSTDASCMSTHIPGEIIPYSELELADKRPIGSGGFGEVFAAKWRGTPVAFKKLLYQRMSRKLHSTFTKEVSILATLNYPHIVKMFGAVVEEGNVGIVMEYMCRSLHRAIHWDEAQFPPAKKKDMVVQISHALEYLHTQKKKIAHCDIKTDNVLLDKDDNAKLSDFGISAIKNATETVQSSVTGAAPPGQGTPRYSAPEVLRGEILTMTGLLQTDIYSLAVVVFELLVEEEPFFQLNVRQLQANVGHGTMRPQATTSGVKLAKPVSDILRRCWDSVATNRPTVTEFCKEWGKITVLCEETATLTQ